MAYISQVSTTTLSSTTTGVLLPAVIAGTNANYVQNLPVVAGAGLSFTSNGTSVSATLNNGGQLQLGATASACPPVVLQTDVNVTTAWTSYTPAYAATQAVLSQTVNPSITGAPLRIRVTGCAAPQTATNAQIDVVVYVYYSTNGGTPIYLGASESAQPTSVRAGFLSYIDINFEKVLTNVVTYGVPITIWVSASRGQGNGGVPYLYSAASTNSLKGLCPLTLYVEELPVGTAGNIGLSYSENYVTTTSTVTAVTVVGSFPTLSQTQAINSVTYNKIYPNTILKAYSNQFFQGYYGGSFSLGGYLAATGTAASAQPALSYIVTQYQAGSSSTALIIGQTFSSIIAQAGLPTGSYTASVGIQSNSSSIKSMQNRLFVYESNPYGAAGTINVTSYSAGTLSSPTGITAISLTPGIQPYSATTPLTSFEVKSYGSGSYIEIDMLASALLQTGGSSYYGGCLYFYVESNLNCPVYVKPIANSYSNSSARCLFWIPSTGAGTSQNIYVGSALIAGTNYAWMFNGLWEEKAAAGGYVSVLQNKPIVIQSSATGSLLPNVINYLTFSGATSYKMPTVGQLPIGSRVTFCATGGTCTVTVNQGQQICYPNSSGASTPATGTANTGTVVQAAPGSFTSFVQMPPNGTQTTGYLALLPGQAFPQIN